VRKCWCCRVLLEPGGYRYTLGLRRVCEECWEDVVEFLSCVGEIRDVPIYETVTWSDVVRAARAIRQALRDSRLVRGDT
jgi:hypothetical protein